MSLEKEVTLRALGAEIVRTPTEAPSESEESNIGVARRLQKLIPGGIVLDQYNNPNNPLAHEFGTGEEIVAQVTQAGTGTGTGERKSTGKVDVFVAGAGTGGTISGCSKAIKRHNPDAIIVGVDPVSIHSFPLSPSPLRYHWSVERRRHFRMSRAGLNLYLHHHASSSERQYLSSPREPKRYQGRRVLELSCGRYRVREHASFVIMRFNFPNAF
jgi:cysteine synthase